MSLIWQAKKQIFTVYVCMWYNDVLLERTVVYNNSLSPNDWWWLKVWDPEGRSMWSADLHCGLFCGILVLIILLWYRHKRPYLAAYLFRCVLVVVLQVFCHCLQHIDGITWTHRICYFANTFVANPFNDYLYHFVSGHSYPSVHPWKFAYMIVVWWY